MNSSKKLLLTLTLALAGTVANASELIVAGQIDSVRVVSVKVANKTVYKNIGVTTYDVIATVESSNSCMIPDMFVKEHITANEIKLSGVVSNRACTAEFSPVKTEVLVGQVSLSADVAIKINSVSVNGLSAAVSQ